MKRNFIITANGQLLMEGRTFTEFDPKSGSGDVIATLTLEDVDAPNASDCMLSVHDILSNLHYKNLKLVCMDEPSEPESVEGETKEDWYEQHDGDNLVGSEDGDAGESEDGSEGGIDGNANQSSGEASGATAASSSAGKLLPIDLPKTVLEQLEKAGVKSLQDAAEKLITGEPLGISATAHKRLVEQVRTAGLMPTDSPG